MRTAELTKSFGGSMPALFTWALPLVTASCSVHGHQVQAQQHVLGGGQGQSRSGRLHRRSNKQAHQQSNVRTSGDCHKREIRPNTGPSRSKHPHDRCMTETHVPPHHTPCAQTAACAASCREPRNQHCAACANINCMCFDTSSSTGWPLQMGCTCGSHLLLAGSIPWLSIRCPLQDSCYNVWI